MTTALTLKNVPEGKEYMISYPDGSRHYLTKEEFDFLAKAFEAGKPIVRLSSSDKLLTNKFTWAGKVSDELFRKPEYMSKEEQSQLYAKQIREKYGVQ